MIKARKIFAGLACAFALCASGLLCTCLGTTYFIDATALDKSSDPKAQADCSNYNDVSQFTLCTHFGLFKGVKAIDASFGSRDPEEYRVFKEHKDVYNIGLVIATIVFILGAIVFGLVATVFGLVNTLTVPIETIHGPVGLYIWNGFGALSSCIAWVLYLTLFYTELKTDVLNESDSGAPYFFETDQVQFGYSFWLLIVGFGLFILNILFVFLAQCVQDPDFLWRKKKEEEFGTSNRNDVGLGLMY